MYHSVTDGFYIGESGIYTRFLRPETERECPLAVIFHGLPGVELNVDLAYGLRESGYAVLLPSYNGAWGSKGDYRIENIPGNVGTVLTMVLGDEFSRKRGIDVSRVAVIGHSLGGWAALISPAIDPRVGAVVALDPLVELSVGDDPQDAKGMLAEMIVPLSGVTAAQAVKGMKWAGVNWSPKASMLMGRPLALLCATGKGALPLEPSLGLFHELRELGSPVEFWALADDHSFSGRRPLIRGLVVDFLQRNLAP